MISNEEYEFDFEWDVDFKNITFPKNDHKKSNFPSNQLFVDLPISVVSPKKVGATPKVPTKNSSKIIRVLDWEYLIMHVLLPWMNHWHEKKLSKEETQRSEKKLQMNNIVHLWKMRPRISLNCQKEEK
jgi:hypothetical protein